MKISIYKKGTSCKVYIMHVQLLNISNHVKKMILEISDRSWIANMNVVQKASFEARAQITIDKIVNNILKKYNRKITVELGEYMISHTAGFALKQEHLHKIVPLAELWKEKLSGNPGFDFHTETPAELIVFGEAKFSGSSSPHFKAVKQIGKFITSKKDLKELTDLTHFVSSKSTKRVVKEKKCFAAAFSFCGGNIDTLFHNILSSTHIDPLLKYPELYLIGIELC